MPFKKNYIPWNKGKKQEYNSNERHYRWIGDLVKTDGLHQWVRKRKPKPQFCEKCNEFPSVDLANKTGVYGRDAENWEWLCRKCHMDSDGRKNNLLQGLARNVINDPKTGKFRRC